MSIYAIGDIQGCYDPFMRLLDNIQFNSQDKLWITGDLVNRGPQSLAVLRFVKSLGKQQKIVLGNHDLHLLALSHHAHPGWKEDTMQDILNAPDSEELLAWLQQQTLIHHDEQLGYTMVHAGLASNWNLETAKQLAQEVHQILQSHQATDFLKNMYGDFPDQWDDSLQGWDRLRCITNFFTRIRFCDSEGKIQLKDKGPLSSENLNHIPWFKFPNRKNADLKIIFGHWAALGGITNTKNVYALDTGCVWGYSLTAMRLSDEKRFCVGCNEN